MNIGDDWGLYLDMIFSKPCTAVFTLERLWYKDIDGQNIYDGRDRHEIVQLLLVEDTQTILKRYQTMLSVNELKVLQKRYISGLMRSEEHTSELQSLMRISYAVFCLTKKKKYKTIISNHNV